MLAGSLVVSSLEKKEKKKKFFIMITKEKYLREFPNSKSTIRKLEGVRGVRVLVYSNSGIEKYEGQYYHPFSDDWVTPFGGLFSLYLYDTIAEALNFPKKMYEKMAVKITKEIILKEKNVERRRKYMNYLGTTEYVKRLDLEVIHEEKDYYGKPMKLFSTKQEDETLQRKLWFLMVTDTSTDREYYLSVNGNRLSPLTSSNAKASTFRGINLWGRQGDVGIIKHDNQNNNHKTIET